MFLEAVYVGTVLKEFYRVAQVLSLSLPVVPRHANRVVRARLQLIVEHHVVEQQAHAFGL